MAIRTAMAVIFTIVGLASCFYVVLAFPSSSSSNSNSLAQAQGSASVSPKQIHVLNPALNRVYRMLHYGGGNSGSTAGDDDELFLEDNIQKRQQYDDYGHMRFGKRQNGGDFDDYGHLRFGK